MRRQPWRRRARPVVGEWLAVWAVVVGALVVFQLVNFSRQPRDTYPTVSSLINLVFDSHPVRALGFALWLALGWYVLRQR